MMNKGLAPSVKPLFCFSLMSTDPVVAAPARNGLLRALLRFFFRHFYHEFAWTYDAVASIVSLGRWNDWVDTALDFVQGSRVLELGHGPGHLQARLQQSGPMHIVGIDESSDMGKLARARLRKAGTTTSQLVRGLGQTLPFADGTFDTVLATFPTEYVFEQVTLLEIRRVLVSGGRLVIIPAAWIVGSDMLDRLAAWTFRATGQAPAAPATAFAQRLRRPFEDAGFQVDFQVARIKSSEVLIVIANT